MKKILLVLAALSCLNLAPATGINWPASQLLPTFSTPAPVLDCIDVSSASNGEIDLFASLEGILNRTLPRVICVSSVDGEGKFTWLNLHNFAYNVTNGYNCILKYRTNFTGLVVTDPNLAHTLNLATTIAGVNNELICDPSLLATLTNAPYNLPIADDLRGKFSDKYGVYGYLYTNYWSQCSHRIMAGMGTNLDGNLRDYLVAIKSATVWLDPGTARDAALLGQFVSNMTPTKGVYMGWWPSEGNGLNWIASYGIPVLASDFFRNGSVFSGGSRTINVPPMPPPPPLENKVYVSLVLSDGDNVQYMQHVMKMDWGNSARGKVPIGWTTTPLSADLDPVLLNHYWSTITPNDCLISGPCGAGYAHIQNWSTANLAAFASVSDAYLQRSGLRLITIWEQVNNGIARAFATNCPTLLGLTDQNGSYNAVDLGLRTIGLTPTYASTIPQMLSGITNAAAGWNGAAPLFIVAQATVWNLGPADMLTIANSFDTNKFRFVRPDHLYLLANRVFGSPIAVTQPASFITATNATIRGTVTGNATNASAWLEWGTNSNYGLKSTVTNPGASIITVTASINGLKSSQVYHYRVVVSNALGVAWGADRQFTTGGRLQVWGGGSFGETNAPRGMTNVIAIASGANHGVSLRNNGTVVAWGENNYGQTNVPAGLTNVIAVAGGIQHSLALLANGTVAAWGDNTYGQTNVPAGLTNVVAIAAGGYHNLALKADQTVVAWGYNAYGQASVPAGLTNVVEVAAGFGHNLALKTDGTVTAWGYNNLGQTNVPAGLNRATAVAAGQYHSVALKENGLLLTNLFPTCRWTADSLIGADGSSVSSWTDLMSGKNATQATAGNQPKLYSNVINGHKTVRFSSASSQYLTVTAADSPISSAGSFTLLVVFKTSTVGSSSSLFYQNTGLLGCEQPFAVQDWAFCINGTQLGAGLGAGANGCGSDLSMYGGTVTDGKPHIGMYVRAGDALSLYVDGTLVAMQNSLCTLARSNYNFQVGAMTTSSYFFNGDIAEIQLYNRGLDTREIVSVNESLAATYGIGGAAGVVVVWGNSAGGLTSVPAGLSNVLAVASGSESAFNLALQANGAVAGWGGGGQSLTNAPAGLTNVTALASGLAFGLAIGNQPPLASNLTVFGYVNHNLSIALPGASPDGSPLNFHILSLPLAGSLYQYSGGTRGLPVNATNTLVSDPGGRIIFAPALGATGAPYAAFGFKCDDGFYGSGSAQITVNLTLPATPQFTGELWNQGNPGNGPFALTFSGSSNATYSVWSATNLINWTDLGTATEIQSGVYQFTDAAASNWSQQFYRLSIP